MAVFVYPLKSLTSDSTDLVRFHPDRSVLVLGRPVQRGAKYLVPYRVRRGL